VPQQIELGVDRIIDSQDNEFVLSAPKDSVATLTLDPQLIQDLTFLFASAAVSMHAGIGALESAGLCSSSVCGVWCAVGLHMYDASYACLAVPVPWNLVGA
jgi:hypothetical protein